MRKLMRCKFCGGTTFKRRGAAVVRIWDKGLGLEDEDITGSWGEEVYDYHCLKCKKMCEDGQLDDLLKGAPFTR